MAWIRPTWKRCLSYTKLVRFILNCIARAKLQTSLFYWVTLWPKREEIIRAENSRNRTRILAPYSYDLFSNTCMELFGILGLSCASISVMKATDGASICLDLSYFTSSSLWKGSKPWLLLYHRQSEQIGRFFAIWVNLFVRMRIFAY